MPTVRREGRPRKDSNTPKGQTPKITLVMDEREREQVKTVARNHGMSLSDFIRTAINNEMMRVQKLGT